MVLSYPSDTRGGYNRYRGDRNIASSRSFIAHSPSWAAPPLLVRAGLCTFSSGFICFAKRWLYWPPTAWRYQRPPERRAALCNSSLAAWPPGLSWGIKTWQSPGIVCQEGIDQERVCLSLSCGQGTCSMEVPCEVCFDCLPLWTCLQVLVLFWMEQVITILYWKL